MSNNEEYLKLQEKLKRFQKSLTKEGREEAIYSNQEDYSFRTTISFVKQENNNTLILILEPRYTKLSEYFLNSISKIILNINNVLPFNTIVDPSKLSINTISKTATLTIILPFTPAGTLDINLDIELNTTDGLITVSDKTSYTIPEVSLEEQINSSISLPSKHLLYGPEIANTNRYTNIFYIDTEFPLGTSYTKWEFFYKDTNELFLSYTNKTIPSTFGIDISSEFKEYYSNNNDNELLLQKMKQYFPNTDHIDNIPHTLETLPLIHGLDILKYTGDITVRILFYNSSDVLIANLVKDIKVEPYKNRNILRNDFYNHIEHKLPYLTDKPIHQDALGKVIKIKDYNLHYPEYPTLRYNNSLSNNPILETLVDIQLPKDRGIVFFTLDQLVNTIHSLQYVTIKDNDLDEIKERYLVLESKTNTGTPKLLSKSDIKDFILKNKNKMDIISKELVKNSINIKIYSSDVRVVIIEGKEHVIECSTPISIIDLNYLLEEDIRIIYGVKLLPKTNDNLNNIIDVNNDVKYFNTNFLYLGLIPFDKQTHRSLLGFQDKFDGINNYYIGQEVVYDNKLYVCKKDYIQEKTLDEESRYIIPEEYFELVTDTTSGYKTHIPTYLSLIHYLKLHKDLIKEYNFSKTPEDFKGDIYSYYKSKYDSEPNYENDKFLGTWLKFYNLNRHKVIYMSSKPVFYINKNDGLKNTLIKVGLTHPYNNLIRVGTKYYYVRLVTDLFHPEDDCALETRTHSPIPNEHLDFNVFRDPSVINNRESLIDFNIRKSILEEYYNKGNYNIEEDYIDFPNGINNVIYSSTPRVKQYGSSERLLDNLEKEYGVYSSVLDYSLHLHNENGYNNIEDKETSKQDYIPIHLVLELIEEQDLPIKNIKRSLEPFIESRDINPLLDNIKLSKNIKIDNITILKQLLNILKIDNVFDNIDNLKEYLPLDVECIYRGNKLVLKIKNKFNIRKDLNDYLKYRPRPIDRFSKEIDRVKINTEIFDVSLELGGENE